MLKLMVLALACLACGKEAERARPAADQRPAAFDVGRAITDPAALVAAVQRPPRDLLPSFRLRAQSKLAVTAGGATLETLDEEALVERAPAGELHVLYGNSREHGRELFAAGGLVWVRPRYGKFHRRPPAEPGEAERVADEVGGTLAADLELVAPAAHLSDGGRTTVAGRAARKVVLARAATPSARPAESEERRAWRGKTTVEALEGELALDEATGVLLAGRLVAQVSFERDGQKLAMALSATHGLEDVGAAIVITPPPESESAPTPQRQTELDDREELLSGLAPPSRKPRPQQP